MTETIQVEDLLKVDEKMLKGMTQKSNDRVVAVLAQKSVRVANAIKDQESRDNAVALEADNLRSNDAHVTLMREYVARNMIAVAPIKAFDALEAQIKSEYDAIQAKYADEYAKAQAAAAVYIHDIREVRAQIEALGDGMYTNMLSQHTAPEIAARLHKRGRGRGRGGARTESDYEAGDIVYLQHANKITGEKFIWQTVATGSGVMVHGVDTADSTAVFDLRTGVDDALRDQEQDTGKPYHPGKAFKTYPPAGKAYVGVEIVDISE